MTTAVAELEQSEIILRIPNTLAEATRNNMETLLRPLFDEAGPLCIEARKIVVTSADDESGMKHAGDVRKSLKRIRVNAEKKRKELKDEALRTGQAIDGIFRPFDQALTAHESYLQEQEDFAVRLAEERAAKIKAERESKLSALGVDPSLYNVVGITDEAFDRLYADQVAAKKAREEAARKAEEERKAAEARAAEEREAQRKENERLRAEAAEREAAIRAEREKVKQQMLEAEQAARKEREAVEVKTRDALREIEAKAKQEREAREKLEREQREREAAEAKRKADEEKAAKKAARAPDKKKAQAYAQMLRDLPSLNATTPDGKKLAEELDFRIGEVCHWIDQQAAEM